MKQENVAVNALSKAETDHAFIGKISDYPLVKVESNNVGLCIKTADYSNPTIDVIKVERQQKPEALLYRVPSYYCNTCDEAFQNYSTCLKHLKETLNKKRIKHIDIEPMANDPGLICKSCKRKFTSIGKYWQHLKSVHYMILGPRKKLKPVPDDPNNYCCVCDITCHTRALYAEHYRSTHQSISVTGSNANMRTKPKLNDASNHCCSCDRQFASKTLYCKHLAF